MLSRRNSPALQQRGKHEVLERVVHLELMTAIGTLRIYFYIRRSDLLFADRTGNIRHGRRIKIMSWIIFIFHNA